MPLSPEIVLRLSTILTIAISPLLAAGVIGASRPALETVYSSPEDAMAACQTWQRHEGLFSTGRRSQPQRTRIRVCNIDLDQPVVLGQRYSVVVGAHYDRPLQELHRKLSHRFSYQVHQENREL